MFFEPGHPILESYKTLLDDAYTKVTNAVAHRNAVKSGAKAPKWKSLLAQPVNDTDALSFVDETLADLLTNFDITKDSATDAAHVAQKLYKLADYFAEQASLWATDLPSDHGQDLSDDEIKALTAQADYLFGKFMDETIGLSNRKNDPAIESLIVQVTGKPVLAKKFDDGTVRYQLDIERIRAPRTQSTNGSGNKGLALSVDGIDMSTDGNPLNFAQQVDMAFSLKALDFLDQLKSQCSHTSTHYNTDGKPMLFAHNSRTYSVTLTKVK